MAIEGQAPRRTRPVTGLAQLRTYRRSWLRADVLAGITVTAYLVPQCLAYSELAGASPVSGLWVAVFAMVIYALLGTSGSSPSGRSPRPRSWSPRPWRRSRRAIRRATSRSRPGSR